MLARAARPSAAGAEQVWGTTLDFVNVGFLAQGAKTARSVGRVAFRSGQPLGSGFLIGAGLFITNHHVISRSEMAEQLAIEFDYELDLVGRPRAVTRFMIDSSVFVTDPVTGLDYTVLAIGQRLDGELPLETFGFSPISDASDKHMLGEFANIVQHPQGRFKEVVLRENRLVSRSDVALHYLADTERGSSGSPVYNSEWRVIALHHWGGPWIQETDEQGRPLVDVNEGVRISSIVKNLRNRQNEVSPEARARILQALKIGETPEGTASLEALDLPPHQTSPTAGTRLVTHRDGRVTWTLPIEISVAIPALAGASPAAIPAKTPTAPSAAEAKPSRDYSDRGGFKERFIEGHVVQLPRLNDALNEHAAVNKLAEPGDDEHELKYHHFSVVVNSTRKLAFFTACNINGAAAKSVKRGTNIVVPLRPDDAGLESLGDLTGAEASENWYHDERLDKSDYAGPETYADQRVPGFPSGAGRIARMFQRGHLVRRLDPVWGSDKQALAAEADTFHWTNCSPQVGFFNQGSADPSVPESGGGRLWRAVENYVLRNAVAEKQRVNCFTGPIFDDEQDRPYRSIKIPGRFFKIAVWSEGGELRSLAMIADQRPVLEVWPEALWSETLSESAQEAFQDADELDKVRDFLSSLGEVESLTGIDFGSVVRAADVREDSESVPVLDAREIPLRRGQKIRRARNGGSGPNRKQK
jgi:endonuclease G